MAFRDPAHRYPAVVITLCVLVTGVAIGMIVYSLWPVRQARSPGVVFLDEGSGELSYRSAREIPPVSAGGRTLVRAVMIREPLARENIAYLFRFTPEAKQRLEAATADPNGDYAAVVMQETIGKEVRLPAHEAPWIPADSPDATAIVSR